MTRNVLGLLLLLGCLTTLPGCGESTRAKLDAVAEKVDRVVLAVTPALKQVQDELPGQTGNYLGYVLAALGASSAGWQRFRVKAVQDALIDSNTPGAVQAKTKTQLAKVGITTEPKTAAPT